MLVCPDCFSSNGLRKRIAEIRPTFPYAKCDFHPTKKGVPIEALAEIVDPVFRENYVGGIYDNRYDDFTGDSLDEVLYDLTGTDNHLIVNALSAQLIENDNYWPPDGEEAFYSEELGYVGNQHSLGGHSRLWASFRTSLLHDRRFFNAKARELIEQIFKDVHRQRDADGQGPVYLIHPGDEQASFFRARKANDAKVREEIESDLAKYLGPPGERGRRPGRLNPSGISAFYGAFDLDTCIAELRPSVGDIIMGAQFQITEPICVLDTTRFAGQPKEPNPFAKQARERAAQWLFMRRFMVEIGRPILPDEEHLDYIPTQAVAEYLVCHHHFEFGQAERTIDAIIYRSAQHPEGKNIAILGDAAVVGLPVTEGDEEPTRASEDDLEFFGWSMEPPAPRPTRIVPLPTTLASFRVDGVNFAKREHFDMDADDFDADELAPQRSFPWT